MDDKDSLSISEMDDSVDSFKKAQDVKNKKRETIFRRKQTLKDTRSYIDKYVDTFWAKQIEGKDLSTLEIDMAVHKLIHQLLLQAEDDPQRKLQVHLLNHMIEHQELIICIKDAIKPGIFQVWFQPFTAQMIKKYFNRVKNMEFDMNE